MKLEDGEYIEDEQEMTLNEFYAATQDFINQGGLGDQFSQFDCSDLAKLIT